MMKPDHRYTNSQPQHPTDASKISHSPHVRRKQYQKQVISSSGQPIPYQKRWQTLDHSPRTSTQVTSNKTLPHPGAIPKQRDYNKNVKSEHNSKVKPSEGSSPRQRRIMRRKTAGDSLTKEDHHRNIPADGLSGRTSIVDQARSITEDSEKSIKAQVNAGKISRKVFRQHKAKRESGKKEANAGSLDTAPHFSSSQGISGEELATKREESEMQGAEDPLKTALPTTESVGNGPPQTLTSSSASSHSGSHIVPSCHTSGAGTSPLVSVEHGLPTGSVSVQDKNLVQTRQSSECDDDRLRREDLIPPYPVVGRRTSSPLGGQVPNSSFRSVYRNPPGSPEHTRIVRNHSESNPGTCLYASLQEESVDSVQSHPTSRSPVHQSSTLISDSFVNHAPGETSSNLLRRTYLGTGFESVNSVQEQSQSSSRTPVSHASTLISDSFVNPASTRGASPSVLRRSYPETDSSPLSSRFQASPHSENLEERHTPLARVGQSPRLLSRERSNQDYVSFRDRQIQRDRERVRGSIINSGVTEEDRGTSLFAHPSSSRSLGDSAVGRLPLLTPLRSEQLPSRQANETSLLGATMGVDTPPPSPTRPSSVSRQDREQVASHLAVMACPLFAPLLFELPPAIMLHMLASARRELGDEFVELLIDNIVLSLLAQQMHDVGLTRDGNGHGDRPAPASTELVESLKKRDVTKTMIDEEPKCAICHVEYELTETLSELPCNHFFHHTCISIWLNKTATCPVCRYKLQSDP